LFFFLFPLPAPQKITSFLFFSKNVREENSSKKTSKKRIYRAPSSVPQAAAALQSFKKTKRMRKMSESGFLNERSKSESS